MGLYLDEFKVGETYESQGRTITETDVVMFACMTGDMHINHTNEDAMRASQYGKRIAHGLLGIACAHGFLHSLNLIADTAIAFLEIVSWKFHKPVFFGDTIRLRLAVHDVIPSKSKPDRGIVKFSMEIVNQDGDVVQSGVKSIMMKRKPSGNQ